MQVAGLASLGRSPPSFTYLICFYFGRCFVQVACLLHIKVLGGVPPVGGQHLSSIVFLHLFLRYTQYTLRRTRLPLTGSDPIARRLRPPAYPRAAFAWANPPSVMLWLTNPYKKALQTSTHCMESSVLQQYGRIPATTTQKISDAST